MRRLVVLFFLFATLSAAGQNSELLIPSEKPIKPKDLPKAWTNPEEFSLKLQFNENDSAYREEDLDLLDSAYTIAFNRNNPRFYTMSIEAYGDAYNQDIMRARVESVYRYFTMRGHEIVPVRYAYNPIHCSCHGDTVELIRYEVPTDKQVYDCAELPSSRLLFNNSINLKGTVLVTFRHNPVECVGGSSGCYIPSQDSSIRAYYTQLILKKGSIYSVDNTKDSCPPPVQISIEEHLDYQQVLNKYFLVPHRRQIILPIGYVVLHSSFNRKPDECQALTDSIFIRFPVTEGQMESRLRVFAKKLGSKGMEYKPLATKMIKSGPVPMIQAALNPTQFDTIFIAKRINEDEVSKYLYPADSPTEQGAVTIKIDGEERSFKPFRMNNKGEYEFRKLFRNMLRIIEEDEESVGPIIDNPFQNDGDEEIE